MNTLFDELPETEKRDRGIEIAGSTNRSILEHLRAAMKMAYLSKLAAASPEERTSVFVTADEARDVFEIGVANGSWERPGSMNFMGHLFSGREWQFTGRRIKSKTPGSHANEIKCWRYVG